MSIPIVVDYELIQRLRHEGYNEEAEQLVLAHQRSIHKNYESGRKNIHQIDLKERRIKYINNEKCIACGKKKENIKILRCKSCGKKNNDSTKKGRIIKMKKTIFHFEHYTTVFRKSNNTKSNISADELIESLE